VIHSREKERPHPFLITARHFQEAIEKVQKKERVKWAEITIITKITGSGMAGSRNPVDVGGGFIPVRME
jgi:hypothetical protein